MRLFAVDALAAIEGLRPDQSLADARTLVPELLTAPAEPHNDKAMLVKLTDWCIRYTPSAALNGEDGLLLDITGCTHLFGGEEALAADITQRLAHARIAAKVAIADSIGAAWAIARFSKPQVVLSESAKSVLVPLPTAALRLPAALTLQLHRLGLRRIGDLLPLPRASLVTRFGSLLTLRLDQLLGHVEEPIRFHRSAVQWRSRIAFAEPISRREDIDLAVERLLDDLMESLGRTHRGVRKLALIFCRMDGAAQIIEIGTAQPTRNVPHLAGLFAEKLDTVDPGFGIETALLEAVETDGLMPHQTTLSESNAEADLAPLIDRLRNRLGDRSVFRVVPVASYIPERAIAVVPALEGSHGRSWPSGIGRPLRLLPCPEPIDVTSDPLDDGPSNFRWRSITHRVTKAEGPERIEPEWWRAISNARSRDYYWFEDEAGRRFWVYCAETSKNNARWYLHGLFA